MSKTNKVYIKGPDGRIVAAQQSQFHVVDGKAVLIPSALKDGWAEAGGADIEAQAAANAKRAQKGG